MIATISPSSTVRLTSRKACTAVAPLPKARVRSRASSSGAPDFPLSWSTVVMAIGLACPTCSPARDRGAGAGS